MKAKSLLLGVAAVAIAAAGTAHAADPVPAPVVVSPAAIPAATPASQWYVSVFGGLALKADVRGMYYDWDTIDLQANHGFLIGGAFGTWLSTGFRSEIEVTYVRRKVNDPAFMEDPQWCGSPPPACDANGTLGTIYLLGNAWFHPRGEGAFSPYVGIGAGMAFLKPRISLYEGDGYDPFYYGWVNGGFAAAAQLGAGVQYALNDRLTLDASYRMRAVLGGHFSDTYDGDYVDNAVNLHWLDQALQLGVLFGF